RAHTPGRAVKAIGKDPFDAVRRLLVDGRALEHLIRLGKGGRTGLCRIAQVPEDTASDNRGQVHLLRETTTVLLVGQEVDRQWQPTAAQDRDPTVLPQRTDETVERHGRDMMDPRAPFQTEPAVRG